MYTNPLYYLLLVVSSIIFAIFIHAVHKNNRGVNFEFFESFVVDNNMYWEYNNILYHAKIEGEKVVENSIIKVDSYGLDGKELYKMLKEVNKV